LSVSRYDAFFFSSSVDPLALHSFLHDALPIFLMVVHLTSPDGKYDTLYLRNYLRLHVKDRLASIPGVGDAQAFGGGDYAMRLWLDRKSTRLNSSHVKISYAVFCLKKKKQNKQE